MMEWAEVAWKEEGTPWSGRFDDIYYSRKGGVAETQFVFLEGNRLTERWTPPRQVPAAPFVIGESGFGTGLNFLVTWELSVRLAQPVRYVSFEMYPMRAQDIETSLRASLVRTPYQPYLDLFLNSYQTASLKGGVNSFDFGEFKLDLVIGEMLTTWRHLGAQLILADAWYLDGFAPSKNESLWCPELLQQISLATRAGGTFATYTANSNVRRALQMAGFEVVKTAGFAGKRERLIGHR